MKSDASGVELKRMLTKVNALRLMFVIEVKGQSVSDLTVPSAVKNKRFNDI